MSKRRFGVQGSAEPAIARSADGANFRGGRAGAESAGAEDLTVELDALYRTSEAGLALLDRDLRYLRLNERLAAMNGVPLEGHLGRTVRDVLPRPAADAAEPVFRQVFETGEPVQGLTLVGETAARRGVVVTWLEDVLPIKRRDGSVRAILVRVREVAPEDAGDPLANGRLAAIVDSSSDAIVGKTLDGVITSWNPAAERLFGYVAEDVVGRHISMLAAPGRENEMPQILERLRRGEKVESYETVRRRKDGSLVDVALTISPIRDRRGRIVGASKIARDITMRRQAEEQQRLLAAELAHRIRNVFAVVQVVAERTGDGATTVPEFLAAFRGRLRALNAAHGAITTSDWRGAHLTDVVRGALEPYLGDDERLTLDLPDLALKAEAASTIALAVHELATNAAKYGALSCSTGRIGLRAWIEPGDAADRLRLEWHEHGGPPVEEPSTSGFGTGLLDRAIGYQYGGTAELIWRREGLVCRMDLPLDAIALEATREKIAAVAGRRDAGAT